jgi:rhodanese-related sulfurtransferase
MTKLNLGKSLLASALLTIAFTAAAIPSVDVKQIATLQNSGGLVIDVREAEEYAQGHAPGSTLIPLGQLQQRLSEIGGAKNKPVALICQSGRRLALALGMLEKAGFSAAVNVEGGMLAWKKAGLPVVAGAASR